MSDELLDYLELFRTLGEKEVDYVLVGGLAVNVHGVIRATADADIVPSPERTNLEALSTALRDLEAHVPGSDPSLDSLSAATPSSGVTVKCETRYGPLHVVQSQPGLPLYGELRSRATDIALEDLTIPVCSYEDLVAMKRAAGRPQDEIDLADLRAARGEDEQAPDE